MSRPAAPEPVKLIVSVLSADDDMAGIVRQSLEQRYGVTDSVDGPLPFTYTDYYRAELGPDLHRWLLAFRTLVDPGRLPAIKLDANALEDRFLRGDGTRRVNIDPGYIALSHMILATCKPFSHRPYLGSGVYADMTLLFQGRSFQALPWTFPDYADRPLIDLLNDVRARYHAQLRGRKAAL